MNTHEFLLGDFANRLGWTLVHSVWQGVALAVPLSATLAALRQWSAQARYIAASGAPALMLTCVGLTFYSIPTLCAVAPQNGRPSAQADAGLSMKAATDHAVELPAVSLPSALVTVPVDNAMPRPASATVAPPVPAVTSKWISLRHHFSVAAPWLSGTWLIGVLALSVWHLGGWIAAQRLCVLGVRPASSEVMSRIEQLSHRLGVSRVPTVLQSLLAETPMVIGWLRPVILLPVAVLSGLTPEQLGAVLAHELAHVRRYDYLVNLFQVAAETLLFYHPAVWFISRRIRLEREQCCDDVALSVCGDRCAYASSLAALEEVRLGALPALAASGSRHSHLLMRVRRLLGQPEDAPHRLAGAVTAVAILAASAVILGGVWLRSSPARAADTKLLSATTAPTGPIEISGKVVDDATGQPVPNFSVQGGHVDDEDPSKITWGYTLQTTTSANPTAEFSTAVDWTHGWRARIVASGYAPLPILSKLDDVNGREIRDLVVRLKRGRQVSGHVYDHIGQPVAGAGVYVVGNPSINLTGGRAMELAGGFVQDTKAVRVATDAAGAFSIRGISADSRGIAVTSKALDLWVVPVPEDDAKTANLDIRLPQPGKLVVHYDIPGAPDKARVMMQLHTWDIPGWQGVSSDRYDPIQQHLDLVFDKLTPGEYVINRCKNPGPKSSRNQVMLDRQHFKIESGKTTVVDFVRPAGSPITGQVVGLYEGEVGKAKPTRVSVQIRPEHEEPSQYLIYDTVVTEPEGDKPMDGAFTTELISPGRYKLRAEVFVPETAAQGMSSGIVPPAFIGETVVIVPEQGRPEPVRIGLRRFEVGDDDPPGTRKVEVGQIAPLFQITSLDGKPLRLADYRGKFVLLDFWATWCGPCLDEVPHIKATYDAFAKDPRLAIIGLSLDKKPATPQKFAEEHGLAWAQGFLGMPDDEPVAKDYGVHGIPSIWLIGPDGKVIAKNLRGKQIKLAVEAALSVQHIGGALPGPDVLSGTVVDEAGNPIAGALVDVWTWCPGNETRTDRHGHYVLKQLGADPVEIRFSKDGFGPWYNPNQPTGVELNVRLSNKTYFEGMVKGPDGKPVKNALVRTDSGPKHNPGVEITSVWTETHSDQDGYYRLYVAPDQYVFHVHVPNVGVARLPAITIADGQTQKLDISLTPGLTFRADVVDSQTGAPVPNVRLWHWEHPGIEGTSDKDGHLTIDGMAPGNFVFDVGAKGYTRWWAEQAAQPDQKKESGDHFHRNFDSLEFDIASEMKPVRIELEREVRITGKVLDPLGNPVAGATVAPALTGTGNSLTGDTRFSVITSPTGTFEMSLPASGHARYNLEAHDGQYGQWRHFANGVLDPIMTSPGQELKDVVIHLTQSAGVSGIVKDEDGKPVAGREVRATATDKMENRYYDPKTLTDKDGKFFLRFVRPGEHLIEVAPPSLDEFGEGERSVVVTLKEGGAAVPVELQAASPKATYEEQFRRAIARSDKKDQAATQPATLEQKLVGRWRGEPCQGDYTFKPDGTYELRNFTPGGNTLTGTWSIRNDALPPTLVLTCKTSDFKKKDPASPDYPYLNKPLELKLLKLNSGFLIYQFSNETSEQRFQREIEKSDKNDPAATKPGAAVPPTQPAPLLHLPPATQPASQPTLNYGPEQDGLQLALEIESDHGVVSMGKAIKARLHFRNAGKLGIKIKNPTLWQPSADEFVIADATGNRVQGYSAWFSFWDVGREDQLEPGESVAVDSHFLGFFPEGFDLPKVPHPIGNYALLKPGKYTVQYKLRCPTLGNDMSGSVIWHDQLTTAPLQIEVALNEEKRPSGVDTVLPAASGAGPATRTSSAATTGVAPGSLM